MLSHVPWEQGGMIQDQKAPEFGVPDLSASMGEPSPAIAKAPELE